MGNHNTTQSAIFKCFFLPDILFSEVIRLFIIYGTILAVLYNGFLC